MSDETSPATLPEGWIKKELGDVCLKVSKIDPLDLKREIFKYVDIGSIDSATNSVASPQTLSVKDAPGRARQLVNEGDTVFSTVRPYLKNIAYINESLDGEIASTGFCVIRANPKIVSKGLIKFFSISDNLLEQILPLQRGVSYPAVRDKDLFSASILVPPLLEQQKIVEILEEQLSRLDAALASVRAVRVKAGRFRRSLLNAAFTGALTGHDKSVAALPRKWDLKPLGEIADVGWGDLQVTKSSYVPEGHIAYSATGPDGFLDYFDFDQDGIVLSAIGAGCGRTWFAKGKWSAIKNTMTIVEKSNEVHMRFLFQQLSDPEAWPKRGSGQPFISQKDAREMVVKIPPLEEQEKIVDVLDEQISRLNASLAVADAIEIKAKALRRSLLHAAFTGELTKEWREGAHV